jgi:hypothetical protein
MAESDPQAEGSNPKLVLLITSEVIKSTGLFQVASDRLAMKPGSQCEKYTHLSELKEWTQRHRKYSKSKALLIVL